VGKIDMVITKSVTRFARNTLTTLEAVRELKSLGVDVFFEKENIHSISGDGELMLTILASYAQEESRSVSENCKWRIRKLFREGRATFFRMFGYFLKDGKLQVVPEEAVVVRQIFADFLAGMGKIAIAKKLNAQGVPTKCGGTWWDTAVYRILRNEKYSGDMVLQKTYSQDAISKRKCINRGELPQYRIMGSHQAIVSRATFAQVQRELARRAAQCAPASDTPTIYPFSHKILCEQCGRHYRRKHTAAGSKYEKVVWICHTFNTLGKAACSSQQIPECILYAKTAEILALPTFDERVFQAKVAEIRIPSPSKLVFVFHDGQRVEVTWQNPSRRESWTEAMKQAARERQNKILAERSSKHES
jgi:DNA invertase Pin-like site-specific DNA recombinase